MKNTVIFTFIFAMLCFNSVSAHPILGDNYPPLGIGCTTSLYIDRDCDGYGVGYQYVLGPDADDTDATVNTPATAIAKYGSMQNFISSGKGYSCLRYAFLDKTHGTAGQISSSWTTAINNPYSDLGALPAIQPGDCIIFRGSPTNTATFTSDSQWLRSGTEQNRIIYMAYPGESAVWSGRDFGGAYLTWDGLQTVGNSLSGQSPAAPGLIVRNCESYKTTQWLYAFTGIKHWLVEYNVIHNNTGGDNSHCIYMGNRADGKGGTVGIDAALPFPSENITFRGNVFYSSGCEDFIQYNGYVGDNGSGVGLLIENNIFGTHGGWGALDMLMGVNDLVVRNNVFTSGGGGQIRFHWYHETPYFDGYNHIKRFDMNNIQIYGNSFHIEDQDANGGQSWQGFAWINDDTPLVRPVHFNNFNIYNNVFYSYGISSPYGEFVRFSSANSAKTEFYDCSSYTPKIYNNVLYRAGGKSRLQSADSYIYSLEPDGYFYRSGIPQCTSRWYSNIYADPRYNYVANNQNANWFNYDLRISNTSTPAINAGTSGGAVYDMKGNLRVGNDAGAYELSGATGSSYTYEGMTLVHGNALEDDKRIVLVFIGNGWQKSNDQSAWINFVNTQVSRLKEPVAGVNWFRDHQNWFNIYRIDAWTNVSGQVQGRYSSTDVNVIYSTLESVKPNRDFAVIVHNWDCDYFSIGGTTYGCEYGYDPNNAWTYSKPSFYLTTKMRNKGINEGLGSSYYMNDWDTHHLQIFKTDEATYPAHTHQRYILSHELVHLSTQSKHAQRDGNTYVYLNDEYAWDGDTRCTNLSKSAFNIHDRSNNDKWSDIIATTPFEGGKFCVRDLWRPEQYCLMRDASDSNGHNLCSVCYQGTTHGFAKYLDNTGSFAYGEDNTQPSLTVSGIVRDGGPYSGTINVVANVAPLAPGSNIRQVEFYFGKYNGIDFIGPYAQNSVLIDRTFPYEWAMNTSNYPDGRYAVDVIVIDSYWNFRKYMTWFNINNSVPPSPTCQNQGYSCCSSCQSGPHTQYDPTCPGQVCCDSCVQPPQPQGLCTGLVLLHHYDGTATDSSGMNNNGTMQYNAFINVSGGKFAGAAQLDGDGDMLLVPNSPSLNFGTDVQFTISLWVKSPGTDSEQVLLGKRGTAGYKIYFSPSNQIFRCDEGATNTDTRYTFPFGNSWHLIVAGRNSSHNFVWVDGVLHNATADSTLADLTDPINLSIGGEYGYTPGTMTGSIDDLAIWNRSLSSAEIQTLYSSNQPVSCGAQAYHRADTNQDCVITLPEITGFIALWHQDSTAYPMRELIEGIGKWKAGTAC